MKREPETMTRAPSRIAGQMTARAYTALADKHRPTSWEALQHEIVRLHREQGLKPRDISLALCVGLDDVLQAIKDSQPNEVNSNA